MPDDGNDEDAPGVSKDDVLPSVHLASALVYIPSREAFMPAVSSLAKSNFGLRRHL